MKRILFQISKVLGVVLTLLIVAAVGFEISNMRAMAKSSKALNEFCGTLGAETTQADISSLVQKKEGFRFAPMDDSSHCIHVIAQFALKRVRFLMYQLQFAMAKPNNYKQRDCRTLRARQPLL